MRLLKVDVHWLRMSVQRVVPPWSFFSHVGNSKVLRELARWFVFVPILARMLTTLTRELIQIPRFQFVTHFALPFDWQLLYYSAFSFMLGGLVYEIRAPRIFKDFSSFFVLTKSNPGANELIDYLLEIAVFEKGGRAEKKAVMEIIGLADDPREYITLDDYLDSTESAEQVLRKVVFTSQERSISRLVWKFCEQYRALARMLCCIFYISGFGFVGLAFAADFHTVLEQSVRTGLLRHIEEVFFF